ARSARASSRSRAWRSSFSSRTATVRRAVFGSLRRFGATVLRRRFLAGLLALERRLIRPSPRLTRGIVTGEGAAPEVALSRRGTVGCLMPALGHSRHSCYPGMSGEPQRADIRPRPAFMSTRPSMVRDRLYQRGCLALQVAAARLTLSAR